MLTFRTIRDAILAAPAVPLPYGEEWTPARLAALRATPHKQGLLAALRLTARQACTAPIPPLPFSAFRLFSDTGSRAEYEQPYFERRARLAALALVALVDESDEGIAALQDLIWAICEEYTWCVPAHQLNGGLDAAQRHRVPPEQMIDLFAAETAAMLAEILTLLGQRLDPWMEYRIRGEVERRVFQPLFSTAAHFGWEAAPHNWAAVCMGNVGMAALLLENDRERLAGVVERVVRALECFLDGYGDDGGCAEGIGYWRYGFGHFVYFAESLRVFTHGQLDLLALPRVAQIAAFPAQVELAPGSFLNYADAGAAHLPTGLLFRLAHRLHAPLPHWQHIPAESGHQGRAGHWANLSRSLLWDDPPPPPQPRPSGIVFLPNLAWLLDRRKLADVPVAFSAKGGHNAEPHNHNDLGHFIINLGGESLLCDLGAGRYSRDYFHGDRTRFLHLSSEGHSLPLIDGQTQQEGPQFGAEVLACTPQPDGVALTLDLTGAYAVANLARFERRFVWQVDETNATATLTLSDSFSFHKAPDVLEERFISLVQPTVRNGEATWCGQRGSVTMRYNAARLSAHLAALPTENHSGEPITVYRLELRATAPQPDDAYSFVFTCSIK